MRAYNPYMIRSLLLAAAGVGVLLAARPCSATDCAPSSGVSPCVDSDPLWPAAGRARFVATAPAQSLGAGNFSYGVAASYADDPVVLVAPSPDPDGRDVAAIDHELTATQLFAIGATRTLDVSLALPYTLSRSGTGVQGVTSQDAPPLRRAAARDPRLGASWSPGGSTESPLALALRLEVSLPLGDEDELAGSAGPTLAPSATVSARTGPLFAGGELGVRLRRASELAGVRVGSQLRASLGVGVDIFDDELLSLLAEIWALPSLVAQPAPADSASRATFIPSEWLLSVRNMPQRDVALQVGVGTALPVSSRSSTDDSGATRDESFAAVTSPAWRIVAVVRYVPSRDED